MNKQSDVLIAVDNDGFVVVPDEKKILVIEIIKHFTDQWKEKAESDRENGKSPRALGYVHSMLNRLNVPHSVLPVPIAYMHVLDGMEQMATLPEDAEATTQGPTQEPISEEEGAGADYSEGYNDCEPGDEEEDHNGEEDGEEAYR